VGHLGVGNCSIADLGIRNFSVGHLDVGNCSVGDLGVSKFDVRNLCIRNTSDDVVARVINGYGRYMCGTFIRLCLQRHLLKPVHTSRNESFSSSLRHPHTLNGRTYYSFQCFQFMTQVESTFLCSSLDCQFPRHFRNFVKFCEICNL